MKVRFVIGYILLAFGLLGSIYMASEFIRLFFAPPTGNIVAGLGAGIAWALYLACSILFIIPGVVLIRKHESFVRRAIGIIVILLGIMPQVVVYLHIISLPTPSPPRGSGLPAGPPPGPSISIDTIIFFSILPLVLYIIPGILLILPSRSSQ
jgi:hypothetical protein